MTEPASLLDVREGRTKTDILGEVAETEANSAVAPRLTDLNERIPATQGAVSNNLGDLVDAGVLNKDEDNRYSIDRTGILALYREHVDAYLTRERPEGPFEEELSRVNDARTKTKRRLRDIFDENELLSNIMIATLADSRQNSRIRTIPDVCYHADGVVRALAVRAVTSGKLNGDSADILDVLRIAIVLDQTRTGLARLVEHESELQKYMPGSPPELAMLDHVNGGSN
jgi:hypothetical protein